MFMFGVAVAGLLVALLAVPSAATLVNGVGYPLSVPLNVPVTPFLSTPVSTSSVADRRIHAAALACTGVVPLYRTAVCDIISTDNCGNLVGDNHTAWSVTVQSPQHISRLVSPVIFMSQGWTRFYFTPVEYGFHEVTVGPKAGHPFLLSTPLPMRFQVVVRSPLPAP